MCSLEFSDIEPSIWQAFRTDGLVVIGINPGGLFGGDTPEILRNFREQTGATFPLGWDNTQSYNAYRTGAGDSISPFPLDVVIGKDQTIRYVSREYEPTELTAVIGQALAQ